MDTLEPEQDTGDSMDETESELVQYGPFPQDYFLNSPSILSSRTDSQDTVVSEDTQEKNEAIPLKPTFKNVLQAKKRLQAFSANKQQMVPVVKKEKEADAETVSVNVKKVKKELNPDERAKAVIQEIEAIKREEAEAELSWAGDLKSRSRSRSGTPPGNHFRKRKFKSRNYRRNDSQFRHRSKSASPSSDKRKSRKSEAKKVSPKKVNPVNWTEYKQLEAEGHNLKEKVFSKQGCGPTETNLLLKFLSFQSPAPTIEKFYYQSEKGNAVVPFPFLRSTTTNPCINYSVNFNNIKEIGITRRELFQYIPPARRELIEKMYNTRLIFEDKPQQVSRTRSWYPILWNNVEQPECKLLETSVGLSFLQNYSDEDDETVENLSGKKQDSKKHRETTNDLEKVKKKKKKKHTDDDSSRKQKKKRGKSKHKKRDLSNDDGDSSDEEKQKKKSKKKHKEKKKNKKTKDNSPVKEHKTKKCDSEIEDKKESKRSKRKRKRSEDKRLKNELKHSEESVKKPKRASEGLTPKRLEEADLKQASPENQSEMMAGKRQSRWDKAQDLKNQAAKVKARSLSKDLEIPTRSLSKENVVLATEDVKIPAARSSSKESMEKILNESFEEGELERSKSNIEEELLLDKPVKPNGEARIIHTDEKTEDEPSVVASVSNEVQELIEEQKPNAPEEKPVRSRSKSDESKSRPNEDKPSKQSERKHSKSGDEKSSERSKEPSLERPKSREEKNRKSVSKEREEKLRSSVSKEREEKSKKPRRVSEEKTHKKEPKHDNSKRKRHSSESKKSRKKDKQDKDKKDSSPDTEEYHSHWESDDDIPPVPKMNNSWESDEEVFERGAHSTPKIPITENISLEIPLNIKPFSRRIVLEEERKPERHNWDKTPPAYSDPEKEIERLRQERLHLTEERRKLELQKIRIKKLEKNAIKKLERGHKRRHKKDLDWINEGNKKKLSKKDKLAKKTDLLDLSIVKHEKFDVDLLDSVALTKTPSVLENEYQEFLKAVTSTTTAKKDRKKHKKSKHSSESSTSSDSSSDSSPHSKTKKWKKHMNKFPVPTKLIITDLDDLLPKLPGTEVVAAPSVVKEIDVVKPLPVPSPCLDNIQKPLVNLLVSPVLPPMDLTVLNSSAIPIPIKIDSIPPLKPADTPVESKSEPLPPIVSEIVTVQNDTPLVPATTDCLSSANQLLTPLPTDCLSSSNVATIPPYTSDVNFASPITDASLDSFTLLDKELDTQRLNKPFVFHTMVLPSKKPLLVNAKVDLDDGSGEEEPVVEEEEKKEKVRERKRSSETREKTRSSETKERKPRSPARKREKSHEKDKGKTSSRSKISPRKRTRQSPMRRRSPHRRRSPIRRRSPFGRRNLSPRRRCSNSPRRRSISPRRRSISPRRRSISPSRRSVSPRRRSISPRRRSISPRRRSISPRRRSVSPRRRSISPMRRKPNSISPRRKLRKRSMSPGLRRILSPPEVLSRTRSPLPVNSPMDGLKKSVADSTISDDLLPQPNLGEDYSESPVNRFFDRTIRSTDSPKRVPLDVRINQVLGLKEEVPAPIIHYNYQNYPAYQQQPLAQHFEYKPMSLPPPPPMAPSNQVRQVGNMLQIVPNENLDFARRQDTMQKIVQVGNMLQIVPGQLPPEPPPLPPPKKQDVTVDKGVSAEELMKAKLVERRAEREKRRLERERRRKEKEKRRKEKEKKKQLKLKLRTENMIKKALELEESDLNQEEDEEKIDIQWPPTPIIIGSISKEASKSILIKGGFSKLSEGTRGEKKSVQFADGIRPGEGTSPSGGEELSSPPPATSLPKEKRFKKIKVPKKSKKKKIKVKVIKKPKHATSVDDSDDEDNLPPPPPPPGSPPPHLFPPRMKTHTINNVHASFVPNLVSLPPPPPQSTQSYQTLYRTPISIIMPPPHHHIGHPPPTPHCTPHCPPGHHHCHDQHHHEPPHHHHEPPHHHHEPPHHHHEPPHHHHDPHHHHEPHHHH